MDKDQISLLLICDTKKNDDVIKFSKQNGFLPELCFESEKVQDAVQSKQWDLIITEFSTTSLKRAKDFINSLKEIRFRFKPALFLSVASYPDWEQRQMFYELGYDDILVRPLFSEEIRAKIKIFFQKKSLDQEVMAREDQLDKSLQYLDKFKNELKILKEELIEEKNSLNNALKQINTMTLERERMKKELKSLKSTLKDNLEGFGHFLSRMIEARIESNRGHAVRVAQVAEYVGKQFKVSELDLQVLNKASMLHEVGLLMVPEDTIKKDPAHHNKWENDFFVQYPAKGADLLNNCSEFEKAAEVIRHLNENSDGTGSPQGLKRRYIPLLSRILAGADVFDSVKDSLAVFSLSDFLQSLEDASGSRLDPNIVSCLEEYAVLYLADESYRVKGIGIHQLEPGMTLGTSLFTETGTKLFSVNTLLTQDAIDKIERYNREYPVNETVYIKA
ncbi:MAG: HD domain-containing protein, partial [Desulfobacteraceae bacterium]|nr:HD domain-containing protein [Desulfobacteraceae bacterium]